MKILKMRARKIKAKTIKTNSQLCSGNNPLPSGSSQRKERLIIFQREDEVYPKGNWGGGPSLHSIPSVRE